MERRRATLAIVRRDLYKISTPSPQRVRKSQFLGGQIPMIHSRSFALFALVCALLFSLTAGPAHAAKAVKCVSTSGDVPKTGTDGSTCDADVITTGKAKATASGVSDAASTATGGSATSVATKGSAASATGDSGGSGKATADRASAASAEGDGASTGTAIATGASAASAVATTGGGVANATAKNKSAAAATSEALCSAQATAKNMSEAEATCSTPAGFAFATATNGGFASASDTGPPTCTPGSGTAKLRSTGGNCGH